MKEEKLRKKLLLENNLNLHKAKEMCVQYETAVAALAITSKEDNEIAKVEKDEQQVNQISSKGGRAQRESFICR